MSLSRSASTVFMPATMKDIAKSLQLSMSTVSYALNGGPRSVSDDVKKRVLAAAEELGYHPNRAARLLATGRAHAIAVVPPEFADDWLLSPYLTLALNGFFKEASRQKQDVLIFTTFEEGDLAEIGSKLHDGRVDGVVFFIDLIQSKETVSLAAKLDIPCVAISGGAVEGICTVCADNQGGMTRALQHLYDLGHRKIAHITGGDDLHDAVLRRAAYKEFLSAHSLPFHQEWLVPSRFSIEGGRAATRQLMSLSNRPTAIACGNDETAIGAMQAAAALGLRVPQDVSITGFDMTPNSSLVIPALTTVCQPIGELGKAAVQCLVGLIQGKPVPSVTVLETELIVRDSTSHPTKETP